MPHDSQFICLYNHVHTEFQRCVNFWGKKLLLSQSLTLNFYFVMCNVVDGANINWKEFVTNVIIYQKKSYNLYVTIATAYRDKFCMWGTVRQWTASHIVWTLSMYFEDWFDIFHVCFIY